MLEERSKFLVSTAAVSLFVTACVFVLIVYRMSQDHEWSRRKLISEKLRLRSAIANMPHGVCMFGADKKLVIANDTYSTMYGLSPEQAKPGTTPMRFCARESRLEPVPGTPKIIFLTGFGKNSRLNPGTSLTSFAMGA